jgi:hypothetical protein
MISTHKILKHKPLYTVVKSCLLASTLLIYGCGSNSGSSDDGNTINLTTTSAVPSSVIADENVILESELSVSGSQSSNSARFALGADSTEVLATITEINYPSVSGVTFTQIIPNGSTIRDCKVGLAFSNNEPNCILKVSIIGASGKSIDDQIKIVTNNASVAIPVIFTVVNEGSTSLPQGQVTPVPIVAPDTTTSVKVINPSSNNEPINNLKLTISPWLSSIATSLIGGTVSTSDGSKVITYTESSLARDLAVGQNHTFGFTLAGTSTETDAILAHYDELITNSVTGVITINGSNLRNPLKPNLTVSTIPASITEEVTISDPNNPQSITLQNLSNSQLKITSIDNTNLPTGVSISGGTCAVDLVIEPAAEADDSCTVILDADVSAVPESNKSLSVSYDDPQSNNFAAASSVVIGGAEISVSLTSISLPNSGNQTTNVVITNTGNLNWLPSNLLANYEITQQGQSTLAADISVTAPSSGGTSCLDEVFVSPTGACNIGILTNADNTTVGNYVLTLTPDNNLTTAKATDFSVTLPSLGSFSFENSSSSVITSQDFEIGDSPFSLNLKNVGSTEITNAYLTVPAKFTTANPDIGAPCPTITGNAIPLAVNASCGIKLSVANGAGIGNGSYNIVANGDVATVDNNGQTLTATVQGAVMTIESGLSISVPNTGSSITELSLTNNGANTITWNPSSSVADYVISGTSISGISIVDPNTSNPYCLTDSDANGIADPVAINGSCVIGIQVASNAAVGTYSVTLNLTNNLAAIQNQSFDITSALGFFSFNPELITLGTDSTSQPQSIALNNNGGTDITNAYLDIPSGLTVTSNNCGTNASKITLASSGNCTFQIAADNNTTQSNPYTFTAIGESATVENNNHDFVTTVNGVVVEIQSINADNAINRPAAGTNITNVELKNLSNIAWTPSTLATNYQITTDDSNISIVAPSSGTDCLVGASVASNASCFVGIQTNSVTSKTNYTLKSLATGNLPQNSPTQSFSVTDSLGYFVYKDSNGDVLTTLNLNIGAAAETITLENMGETAITTVQTNTDGTDSTKFTLSSDNCSGTNLAASASCTFGLSLSDSATGGGTYTFSSTGDNATVSNSPGSFTVDAISSQRFVSGTGAATECMIDTVTNLMWPKKGDFATQDWNAAAADPAGANASSLCGFTDWTNPTALQLAGTNPNDGATGTGLITGWNTESICGTGSETCDSPVYWLQAQGFDSFYINPYRQPWGFYWSGTEDDDDPGRARAVCLAASCSNGFTPDDVIIIGKNLSLGVLPVRQQ